MKKFAAFLLSAMLGLSLAACGSQNSNSASSSEETSAATTAQAVKSETILENSEAQTEAQEEELQATETVAESEIAENMQTDDEAANGAHILVVYFSATGTTKAVAETMADALSADLYEIIPVEVYTDEDLNYNDSSSRSTIEQNDPDARPEISGTIDNFGQYDTVLIGYPIWWSEEPRIMDTFVESYDFTGKTVAVFCTSGGSGVGRSDSNLEQLAGSGTWVGGERFRSGVSAEDIVSWAASLEIQ